MSLWSVPDMLFRVIHCIQSENLFGNPDWHLKWSLSDVRPARDVGPDHDGVIQRDVVYLC
jgi:hypothetical protein